MQEFDVALIPDSTHLLIIRLSGCVKAVKSRYSFRLFRAETVRSCSIMYNTNIYHRKPSECKRMTVTIRSVQCVLK